MILLLNHGTKKPNYITRDKISFSHHGDLRNFHYPIKTSFNNEKEGVGIGVLEATSYAGMPLFRLRLDLNQPL